MDFDHSEWTDKLSDYLDGELAAEERYAIESHLAGCAQCAAVLADLKRVVERARELEPRPPQADLWSGIAARIDRPNVVSFETAVAQRFGAAKRISFTLPQLAAAAALLIAISGVAAWQTAERLAGRSTDESRSISSDASSAATVERPSAPADDVHLATAGFADPQYEAAVADLEKAVKQGRGRLDKSTIAIVEHNLQIIDQAIEQARQALAADPANSYLTGHLFEARRRKLDLLRRAAALTTESD